MIKLAIDLHNIRDGGGVNYIANLLNASKKDRDFIEKIVLFGGEKNLKQFPEKDYIQKVTIKELDGGILKRLSFAFFRLDTYVKQYDCNVLYVPGGVYFGNIKNYVAISRNMMPFDTSRWQLYGYGYDKLRLLLLRYINARTFKRAKRTIFLTEYARSEISKVTGDLDNRSTVIPHGVNKDCFYSRPRDYSSLLQKKQIILVCPGRFEPYKHQLELVEAVELLKDELPDIRVIFCGPTNESYFAKFKARVAELDPAGYKYQYIGIVPNKELPDLYEKSDIMVFPSSCENLPNTLIEGMSVGIPIISSHYSPMPELVRDSAILFDPHSPEDIKRAVKEAVSDIEMTAQRVASGLELSAGFSWESCAKRTFKVLSEVVT